MLKSVEIRVKLDAKVKEAESLNATASKEDIAKITAEIKDLHAQLDAAETLENAQRTIGGGTPIATGAKKKARTLGEHFVNTCGEAFKASRGKALIESPEFRNADTDPHLTTDNADYAQFATEYDPTFVQAPKPASIADLFAKGSTNSSAITYFTKTFDTPDELVSKRKGATAERDIKNKRHYTKTVATDNAGKFTGLTDISEEMTADLPLIASEINNDLVNDVELDRDYQLLHGDGTSPNIRGILNRTGILNVAAKDVSDNDAAIFRGANLIETITPYAADGVAMNPLDYEAIRLKKDANGQYLGGGIFTGAYGNGAVQWKPPVWAKRTVTSAFVPRGKVLVGAFGSPAAKLLNLGGIKIDNTNANKDNFERNMITLRAEQRAILQVKIPQCFCVVTLSDVEA